jgi:sugar phosphate isomerase/epimerase
MLQGVDVLDVSDGITDSSMKSAITVTMVPETKAGPFVFSEGLPDAFSKAEELGFDAVEIFPPAAEALDVREISELMKRHRVSVAALGTGAGWVRHKLTLTHPDEAEQRKAREFVRGIIEVASRLGAPAIVGSMQGRVEVGAAREQSLDSLAKALSDLGSYATQRGVSLLYEPLNRYETNLFNRIGECAAWLRSVGVPGVRILADLFHMNIEEADSCAALREAAPLVGHIHFADSNRRAIGMGQTRIAPIIEVLREIGYTEYLSAEIFPLPDAETAARQTISAFRHGVGSR